ncbi:MAG: dockerin type I repeat-containing protein, partial [candidate division Zixibacteria bacterium]|nr:dockerin type I repeat-containing protein [candidate division Zixibacteria bacterium]
GHVGQGTAWIELKCASPWVPGDANGSGFIDIDDVVYTIAYIFTGGPEPVPEVIVADTDCSGFVDIDDVVYIIAYIFTGGPPPCN